MAATIFSVMVLQTGAAAAGAADIVAGPMVGHVTDRSARLWLQLSIAKTVTVEVYDDRDNQASAVSSDIEGPLPFVCDIPLNNLEPNKTYRVVVKLNGEVVRPPGPEVVIRTAPSVDEEAAFTVGLGGGIDAKELNGRGTGKVFNAIGDVKPRTFLFLGNIGVLPTNLNDFPATRRKAIRFICDADEAIRNEPAMQGLFRTAACYGIWGEHDFGSSGANKDFVYAPESQSAFQRYWANPNWGTPTDPGCYCSFSMGDVDFFLLDERMWRDSVAAGGGRSMLGETQLAWLKKGLSQSRATFKVIGSAGSLLADYPENSWRAYQPEQGDFVKWIFSDHVSGCVFVDGGGGRGLGELTVIPAAKDSKTYPLLELSSDSLAWPKARAVPGAAGVPAAPTNPDRSGAPVLENNFGTLDFGGLREHRFVTMRLRDEAGKIRAEQTVFASQLRK